MNKRKGLTLIELIVSVALFSIILVIVYSFFSFGNNTFSAGNSQYDVQKNLRDATAFISNQIRYATDVEIVSTGIVPDQSTIPQFWNYLYFDSATNKIVQMNKYVKNEMFIVEKTGTNTGSIEFGSTDPFLMLRYKLTAKKSKQEYSLDGTLNPMNLARGHDHYILGTTVPASSPAVKTGTILKYKTANDLISESLMPVAHTGSINTANTFTIEFDRQIQAVEIVYPNTTGVTGAAAAASGSTVTVTTTNTTEGANVTVRVTFNDYEAYGNIYDYSTVYSAATNWTPTIH